MGKPNLNGWQFVVTCVSGTPATTNNNSLTHAELCSPLGQLTATKLS